VTARATAADAMIHLLRSGQLEEFVRRAGELEPADMGDVLAALEPDERLDAVRLLPAEVSSRALIEMPEEAHAEETLAALPTAEAAEIVDELDDDDAADLLGELDHEAQERILAGISDRRDVEELLRYDEESAGGRMTTAIVSVLDTDSAGRALEAIRRQADSPQQVYQIFVVDRFDRLRGVLPLRDLVTSPLDRPVSDFMTPADITVAPDLDQEAVARVMGRYNLPSVPVVDPDGHLLGAVTFDDVADVVEEETTEDILQFGGTSADEELGGGWRDAVRSRLPWLLLNLVTALLAALVIIYFGEVIRQIWILAAIQPIIAGMGGNAGTQALAVTVRRIALGQLPPEQGLGVVGKEMVVGLVNGVVVGVVVSLGAMALHQGAMMGVVVFLAMAGNLVVAGFAGAFIPLLLERFRIDPAVASSIFVTTFTDVCGFTLLLGLAGRLLL
jgi:magnesium transporter